jgi:uncharacterized protein
MRGLHALVVLSGLGIASVGAAGGHPPDPFPGLPRSELQVVADSGTHTFQVWIAADDQSRARGLMHVLDLPAGHGMLFLFEQPHFAAFWMKNTYLSLDLIFIRADGVVVNVAPDAEPLSLQPIESAAPVKAVLEVLAGTANKIGLQPGDRIRHPAFAFDH